MCAGWKGGQTILGRSAIGVELFFRLGLLDCGERIVQRSVRTNVAGFAGLLVLRLIFSDEPSIPLVDDSVNSFSCLSLKFVNVHCLSIYTPSG